MKIKINGKVIELEKSNKLEIEFEGDLAELKTSKSNQKSVNITGGVIGNGNIQINGSSFYTQSELLLEVNIYINGNVALVNTMNGNVEVEGNVSGKIDTMNGNVRVKGNAGKIDTMSGNVQVKGDVQGKISTMTGNIKR